MCDDDGEQRSGRVENGCDSRVNCLLSPGNEEDGNGQAGGAKDGEDAPRPLIARPCYSLKYANGYCGDRSEQHAESDQRHGTDLLHADLDPQEG